MFQEGIAGFILGTDQALTSSNFDISDPCIQIELDSSTAEFPLPGFLIRFKQMFLNMLKM